MKITSFDAEKSFKLIGRLGSRTLGRGEAAKKISLQALAYERLKTLYAVSKLLFSYNTIEKIFPQVLNLCAKTFPFITGIVIEKRSGQISSSLWQAKAATKNQVERAVINAKKSFVYLTGVSETEFLNLDDQQIKATGPLEGSAAQSLSGSGGHSHFMTIPLVVENLPAFGILQLEGTSALNEKDLEFVDALAYLMAVAIDRNYKTDLERELRNSEAEKISLQLTRSQTDISDLVLERELRESFVALLTHDLRTPLSIAKISAQLIQSQGEVSESGKILASHIISSVLKADQMISDLLDANRIKSGEKIPLHIELSDLAVLVKEVLEELTLIHGERFVFSGNGEMKGYWDQKLVCRIIENLSNNAVKYGDPHSKIRVSLTSLDGNIALSVHNRGEPISPSDQIQLFNQFRRTEKAQRGPKQGWGIGLTLVRGVAEAHGGNVQVKSDAEHGTVFTVTLPRDSRHFLLKDVSRHS
jgi:signal transduction histidine kinase